MYESSSYSVKTHVFEGPLDTLLSLIEKRKLLINDISLAQVADDYIEYIKSLQGSSGEHVVSDLAHFILIASTLVLIKSKSLLPTLTLTEDEVSDIEDLETRLREYQKYKELSKHLSARFGIHSLYLRLPSKEKKIVFAPDKHTTVERIGHTIHALLAALPQSNPVPKAIVQKVVSLEEMIESLTARIQHSFKMSFKDFSKHGSNNRADKVHVIVSFLAMLELVKQGIIHVRQEKDFHDIEMETQTVSVPRY